MANRKRLLLLFAPPIKQPKLGELGEEIAPPLGVLYLAGSVRKEFPHMEVEVFDGVRNGFDRSWAMIQDVKPDFLGLSYYTTSAEGAFELSRRTRSEFPGIRIVMGGPHATALPKEALVRGAADIVVRGEGETTLVELLRLWTEETTGWRSRRSSIDGTAWLSEDGTLAMTKPRCHVDPLDMIPFPARDLLNLKDYKGFYISKTRPETSMVMSRGCPFSCTFCSNQVWKLGRPLVRTRSPENIISELVELRDMFGIREVFDHADEFNSNIAAGSAITRAMIEHDIGMYWKTQVRAYPLPPDFVESMAKSGCWYVHLGIESGNEATLDGIGKKVTRRQVIDACRVLKDNGIKVHGLFMLFNVWEENGHLKFEGSDETERTLEFADTLSSKGLLDYIGWSVTTPYPGSKLYDIALKNELIKPHLRDEWERWLLDETFVMDLPGISDQDMARAKSKGSILRGKLLLKSGNLNMSDFGYFLKKGMKIISNEMKARTRRG